MITPKEKAKKLVIMFTFEREEHERYVAKECAKMAVDEILKLKMIKNMGRDNKYSEGAFWKQVKKEIELL